ncbi:hypothetical protein J4423_05630 [Candidatus Pacearchaeota archaeon]|nr:hypothetical protein [Candidatus Pacearchaeota archaeon]
MGKERTFTSKESIDSWFETAIDGLARGIATQRDALASDHPKAQEISKIYRMTVENLNVLRASLYRSTDQTAKPKEVTFAEVVHRYNI